MEMHEDKGLGKLTLKSYMPLIVVISVILLVTLAISIRDSAAGMFSLGATLSYFMIGFFLTFATFKLMDLKGFAEGYSTYDLLASRAPWYGYVYPFIELFFGLAMILAPFSMPLLIVELVVMLFSGLGVAIKLAKREEFVCACLGTFLKVPLTKVTLIENFGMAALALIMLLIK
ncbi:MAG: MauE/DoxX family redox-associated membrane protein [Patescibacteria group bacterium]